MWNDSAAPVLDGLELARGDQTIEGTAGQTAERLALCDGIGEARKGRDGMSFHASQFVPAISAKPTTPRAGQNVYFWTLCSHSGDR
jgi:hypothetical protein